MAQSTRSDQQHLNVTRARQGRLGRDIFFVLIAAMALVVIGFFFAWSWRAGDLASTEPNNAREAVDAQPFDTAPPAPATRQNEASQPSPAQPAPR